MLLSIKAKIRKLMTDPAGVSAVEFAIIAPIMILLFVGTMEVSAAASASRKASRIASAVGDLITQSDNLTGTDINNIMDIAADLMEPFDNVVKIRITGIEIAGGNSTVQWSCDRHWSAHSAGSGYTVPAAIRIDGSFLVAAEVEVDYRPMVGWAGYDTTSGLSIDKTRAIVLDEELFLRPRTKGIVNITGC